LLGGGLFLGHLKARFTLKRLGLLWSYVRIRQAGHLFAPIDKIIGNDRTVFRNAANNFADTEFFCRTTEI
jgi:hypothetical protein